MGTLIPLLEESGWIRATARGRFQCTLRGLQQLPQPQPVKFSSHVEGCNGA
jgi:hypothetical protein